MHATFFRRFSPRAFLAQSQSLAG